MADICGFVNKHGVACVLDKGHERYGEDHAANRQDIPPDPFCLQPTDPFSLACIRAWIALASVQGVNKAKIQRAEEHFKEIERWQKSHGTKLPG